MKNRRAFTLIELLIVLAVLVILVALVIGGMGGGMGFYKDPVTGKSYYSVTNTKTYRCVKTYTMTTGENASTSKRVDLKEIQNGNEVGMVQTFEVDDSYHAGVYDSATLYGQFEVGKYYNVGSVGFRREGWNGFFPLIKSVSEVPNPTIKQLDNPFKAEVGPGDFNE